MTANPATTAEPWWKFGHVWLVIAGPAAVVVAGFITLYLAVSRPDPVISEDYYQKGLDINRTSAPLTEAQIARAAAPVGNLAPATLARNHAATGVVAKPAAKP
jgi:uncharacterized protein